MNTTPKRLDEHTLNSESAVAPNGSVMDRREFIRKAAAMSATAGAGLMSVGSVGAQETETETRSSSEQQGQPFVGIQMGPHTMLDEGIEPCLDLIKETAAVNAVFTYSHAFHADLRKPARMLATDHGTPPRVNRSPLPAIWVKHHDQYFKDTNLRYRPVDPSLEYANHDLFAEMVAPARQRGMKVYARVLEGSGREIENFSSVVTVDVYGRPTRVACWNHPDYKNLWAATVDDIFRSYDLDGFQWGAERQGPLMNVILPWNNTPPTCFCDYCRARAKAHGIDAERARKGYQELYEYVQGLQAGNAKPAEGVFTVFLRHLLRYPEILAWEYQYRCSREDVQRAMYESIKRIKPQAQVGWHVDHQPSSWDLVYRAEMSYAEMAPYSDFIKLILYHAVLGPRIRSWYLNRFQRTILSELSLEQSLDLYYALFGYDKVTEPKLNELATKGFSPNYVYRETKRSVASAAGKTKIYSGIGFDVPGSPPDDPEVIYQAVLKAFEAGASGIVISREYEEMRVPNLKAVGRAVREMTQR